MTQQDTQPPAETLAGAVTSDAIRHLQIRNSLNRAIYGALRRHTMSNMCDEHDHVGFPLVDLMSNPAPADIGTGEMEMVYLADEIEEAIAALTRRADGEQPDTVAFVQEWMMSGDHPADQWHRDFAAAIDARNGKLTTDEWLTAVAERFCATPLPNSVCADPCARHTGPGRTGTNLLTVLEAREMLRQAIIATPGRAGGDAIPAGEAEQDREAILAAYRHLKKVGDRLCVCAETTCGVAGTDEGLQKAIQDWGNCRRLLRDVRAAASETECPISAGQSALSATPKPPAGGDAGAAEERDALLSALGWKTGPFRDALSRKVILDDSAALRPEMVKARQAAQEARCDADDYRCMLGEYVHGSRSGVLGRLWKEVKRLRAATPKPPAGGDAGAVERALAPFIRIAPSVLHKPDHRDGEVVFRQRKYENGEPAGWLELTLTDFRHLAALALPAPVGEELHPIQTVDGLKRLWKIGVETGRILQAHESVRDSANGGAN